MTTNDDKVEFATIQEVEIFSVGKWRGNREVNVTGQMLDEMVTSFNDLNAKVEGYRPPLKLGHGDAQRYGNADGTGAPALGWVDNIRRVGDKIVATFRDVPSSLVDLIRRRLYNSVSIEFLPQVSFGNKTFSTVLSAVAILGSELPAVKGLKELSASLLNDRADRVTLDQKDEGIMADTTGAHFSQAQVDDLTAAAVARAKTEFAAENKAALDAANAKVTAAEAATKTEKERADRAEGALQTFKADRSKETIVAAVDLAIKEGRLLPKQKDDTIAFASALDASTKVKLASGEKSALDIYLAQLKAGPKVVSFTEQTQGAGHEEIAANASVTVDERAKAKMAAAGGADKLSYQNAVATVLAEDPALKTAYFNQI